MRCINVFVQGESRFVCGMSGCDKEWSYEEVCKMALLTTEEKEYFEKTMESIAERERRKNTKSCPECKVPVTRKDESNLSVRCQNCTNKKGHAYEFCWQCLKEWKGPQPRTDHCDNDGCFSEALTTLRNCPDIVFESVRNASGCPCIRACPTCGSQLQHSSKNCKNVVCPRCKVEFCFLCLKVTAECRKIKSLFYNVRQWSRPQTNLHPCVASKPNIINGTLLRILVFLQHSCTLKYCLLHETWPL
uniref:RING-type domain-containing protein n=1 Tax=Oryzias latipes TaxID=8090 RepID=A0A3P9KF40_ORYLA